MQFFLPHRETMCDEIGEAALGAFPRAGRLPLSAGERRRLKIEFWESALTPFSFIAAKRGKKRKLSITDGGLDSVDREWKNPQVIEIEVSFSYIFNIKNQSK